MKHEFPIFSRTIHGKPLTYLDNAASTQKPLAVIETMDDCYRHHYSNIHRGVHHLSQQLSARYDAVRAQAARFVNAARAEEIIYTKGTTEALNLLASSLGELVLKPGDRVLLTALEHHANIVPWQRACQRFGAELAVIPIDDDGALDTTNLDDLLDGVKIFSAALVSNALGTINDLAPLIARAKARGIITVVDAAQAVAHMPVDVQALGCDFLAYSAHKLYGPTGIGILYGRYDLLDAMPPYQSGGDMILSVSFERTLYAAPPAKFEAGTPPIVEVIGLGAALDWINDKGVARLGAYEETLRAAAEQALSELPGLRLIGTAPHKAAVISFTLDGIHPHDAGTVLDQHGVAVRVGQHCAEPVMRIARLVAAVRATQELFA